MTTVQTDQLKEDFIVPFENNKPLSFANYREHQSQLLERFNFPNPKEEAWKYTRLNKFAKQKFSSQKSNANFKIDDLIINPEHNILVFVNGLYRNDLSVLKDQANFITPLSSTKNENIFEQESVKSNFFTSLNGLYFNDGIIVNQSKQSIPSEIIFINDGEQVFSPVKNKILIQANCECKLYFTYHSLKSSAFVNSFTDIQIDKNAKLTLNVLQLESSQTHHYNFINVNQDRDSVFTSNTFSLSGEFIRNDLHIASNGENTLSNLNGLYLLSGSQYVDNHTVMDHRQPNCLSNELYKGVADDQSTVVFNGKVFVRQDAQKINAFQSNANVLLSDDATINSKPELEIYADDVKCSHGSTIGQIDEEALFYLRARGIGEQTAKRLMIGAFAAEVIEKIDCEHFRHHIEGLVARYFEK